MPQDDSWDAEASREIARSAPGRAAAGLYGAVPDPVPGSHRSTGADEPAVEEESPEEVEVVPVRRQLSLAIAGFAALLGVGLILGAQTSAPDYRLPYAIELFGVQLLFVLAWTMALRPPAPGVTAGVCVVVALVADRYAITSTPARLSPLLLIALVGIVAALVGQMFRATDRARAKDTWRSTVILVLGVVAYAILIVLTRQTVGTQTLLVCATAAGVALLIARATDAAFPKPRIAAQVPRGGTGVVLGAMLGTLAAATLGSVLVLPFTPAKGAVLGLVAAVMANLIDLAVNFSEAGRQLAGETPTFWIARHMQGPLGAFAVVAAVAYALAHWYVA